MGAAVKGKMLRKRLFWYLACSMNRAEWQHTTAISLLALWAALIAAVDWPLRAETRQMTWQLTRQAASALTQPRPTTPPSAPRDLTHEFVRSLPEFEKYADQLRALNLLADKTSVVVTRVDYRYDQLPALPVKRLALR